MSTVEQTFSSFRGANAGYFGTDGASATVSGTNTVGAVYGAGQPTAYFALTTDPTPLVGAGVVWDVVQIDPASFVTFPNAPGAPWTWQVPAGIYKIEVTVWTLPVGTALEVAFLWGLGVDYFEMAAADTCVNFSFVRRATADTFFAVASNSGPVQISGSNALRRTYMTITRLGSL